MLDLFNLSAIIKTCRRRSISTRGAAAGPGRGGRPRRAPVCPTSRAPRSRHDIRPRHAARDEGLLEPAQLPGSECSRQRSMPGVSGSAFAWLQDSAIGHHLHLMVQAGKSLARGMKARGMKGLEVRAARARNRMVDLRCALDALRRASRGRADISRFQKKGGAAAGAFERGGAPLVSRPTCRLSGTVRWSRDPSSAREHRSGESSVAALCRLSGISRQTGHNWPSSPAPATLRDSPSQ